MEHIEIPNSVTQIGNQAFFACFGLIDVIIPNSVTDLGEYAFTGCFALKNVTLSNKLTVIDTYAFSTCSSLENIEIPDNVTKIGEYAFAGCSLLNNVKLPKNLDVIEDMAFHKCTSLNSIKIPEGTTKIGNFIFSDCGIFDSIYLPKSIKNIGGGIFKESIVKDVYYAGSEREWGSVSVEMFNEELNRATFHYNYIDPNEPVVTDPIVTDPIVTDPIVTNPVTPENPIVTHPTFDYVILGDGTVCLTYYKGKDAVVDIPAEIDGKKVVKIGNQCFEHNTTITEVTIPDGIISIGDSAFKGCSGLTFVEIPDSVTSIDDWAFSECEALKSVIIPDSMTMISDGTFYKCSSLTSVEIPQGVTTIGTNAFGYCTSLISVKLPDGLVTIGACAFRQCPLPSVEIPESVLYMGDEVFEGRPSNFIIYGVKGSYAEEYANRYNYTFIRTDEDPPVVPDPIIPEPNICTVGTYNIHYIDNGNYITITDIAGTGPNLLLPREINRKPVTVIEENAFSRATRILSVYIPSGVSTIEGKPFAVCPLLTDIFYGGTENSWYTAAAGIAFESGELSNVNLHFNVKGIFNNEPVKEADRSVVEAAYRFNVGGYIPTVYMEGNEAAITKEALEFVKESFSSVTLKTEGCAFTIAPNDIANPADFKIAVKSADSSDNIGHWIDPANAFMIIPVQPSEGNFGMSVEVSLYGYGLPFVVSSAPYLYHVDGNNRIEDYSRTVSYNSDSGEISFSLSHASKYFLAGVRADLNGVPTQPAPTEPTPTQPTPTQPTPTQPAPTQPTPTQPAPTQPTPTQPTPTQPIPTQPTPSQPTPTQPAPTQPVPTQPAPSHSSNSGVFVPPDNTTAQNGSASVGSSAGSSSTNTTMPINSAAQNNEAANGDGSVFAFAFETEAQTTAAAATTPKEANTAVMSSTTVHPAASQVSVNTAKPAPAVTAVSVDNIGNVGSSAAREDKPLNTGDRAISLTPLMIISAAVVFGGTFINVKKKDK